MARQWVNQGAQWLHVIDLDGAFTGQPVNLEWIVRIKKEVGIRIQTGGGIRTMEAIDHILSSGIDKVILGTVVMEEAGLAHEAFEKYKSRIVVALDVKNGHVAVRGWKDSSGCPLSDAISLIEKLGGQEVIYTDISRDGTLEGVNLKSVGEVMGLTSMKIIASGGVSSLQDIQHLKTLGVPACVVGKAIYEGKLKLAEAIALGK
ncbi:MAG: 1-(5-phosphoribosyl)-5-[(5-phosphoribosylamino)methylideneamino] imidazole-4-carboxamide isomerase [Elusimicrobia bacterium]|nr:1-(5-phosphoribosyl)-5-[(5-phosphoribosylamino)methylideneamino] imidazole-4-carboxamide isomerase [Elusimicrobiota bacterium]